MQKIKIDNYKIVKKASQLSSSFNSEFFTDYLKIFTLSILTRMPKLIKISVNQIQHNFISITSV